MDLEGVDEWVREVDRRMLVKLLESADGLRSHFVGLVADVEDMEIEPCGECHDAIRAYDAIRQKYLHVLKVQL